MRSQGRTGTENRPGQFPTTTLTSTPPAQTLQNLQNRLFYTQQSLQPCRPTGHCPNASIESTPLCVIPSETEF